MNKAQVVYACFGTFCGLASVFGLFVGLHADTFAPSSTGDILAEVGRHAWGGDELVDIRALSRRAQPDDLTFVFIADCSGSPQKFLNARPPWLLQTLLSLEARSFPVSRTLEAARVSAVPRPQTIVNAAVYSLLEKAVTTFDPAPHQGRYVFAVWSVCREAKKRYPLRGIHAELTRARVDEAIEALDGLEWDDGSANDTELVPLFEHIVSSYLSENEPYLDSTTPPNVVVSMISDFLDSPGDRRLDSDEIVLRRERLQRALERTARGRTQLNMITIGDGRLDAEVLSYLRNTTDWHRFSAFDVYENLPGMAPRMLYPLYEVDSLQFVHSGSTSRASLQFGPASDVELELPFPLDPQEGVLNYGLRPRWRPGEAQLFGKDGRLTPRGEPRPLEVRVNDILDLSYEGEVPAKRQVLKVMVEADRRSYLMRLTFIPRIPKVSAVVMWSVLWLGLILAGACGLYLLVCGVICASRINVSLDRGQRGLKIRMSNGRARGRA